MLAEEKALGDKFSQIWDLRADGDGFVCVDHDEGDVVLIRTVVLIRLYRERWW